MNFSIPSAANLTNPVLHVQAIEAILPVAAGCAALTPARLQASFGLVGPQSRVLLLALVADDGIVTFSQMHRGLCPPSFDKG